MRERLITRERQEMRKLLKEKEKPGSVAKLEDGKPVSEGKTEGKAKSKEENPSSEGKQKEEGR